MGIPVAHLKLSGAAGMQAAAVTPARYARGATAPRTKFWLSFWGHGTHIRKEDLLTLTAADPKPGLVERLFTEHRGALQSFFVRRIRGKSDAADLAQEVYLRMLRIRDLYAIRDPVLYLYTVANNLVKEHAVLDRRRGTDVDIDEIPPPEQLRLLPPFYGDLDLHSAGPACGTCSDSSARSAAQPWCCASRMNFPTWRSRSTSVCRPRWQKYVTQALVHCRRRMARLG